MNDAHRPIDKQTWERAKKSIAKYPDVHEIAPLLLTHVYWAGVRAYYGGTSKALIAVGRYDFYMWRAKHLTHFLIWVSDKAGWTKVYNVPENEEFITHRTRHGRKCSGSPNCQNENCIGESLPKWFRWITRWHFDL